MQLGTNNIHNRFVTCTKYIGTNPRIGLQPDLHFSWGLAIHNQSWASSKWWNSYMQNSWQWKLHNTLFIFPFLCFGNLKDIGRLGPSGCSGRQNFICAHIFGVLLLFCSSICITVMIILLNVGTSLRWEPHPIPNISAVHNCGGVLSIDLFTYQYPYK